jgi:hypothetical protein
MDSNRKMIEPTERSFLRLAAGAALLRSNQDEDTRKQLQVEFSDDRNQFYESNV